VDYVQLGKTGIRVSPLCLGTMNFGRVAGDGSLVTDESTSIRIIHRALDAGINFVDTANMYTKGASETIVGKALKDGRREEVVLATKFFHRMGEGPNDWGGSRRHIMLQVEGSLKRLGTDWIDLYQMHRPDFTMPIEETLRALDDLVREGKVRYIGSSTFPAWKLCEAQWMSEKWGLARFVSEQPPYSIFARGIEREVVPFCEKHEIALLGWSPVARGWLTDRFRKGPTQVEDATRMAENRAWIESPEGRNRLALVERIAPLAAAKGCTLSQFALAWCLSNPAITSAITGPRTMEQLEDSIGSLSVEITSEDQAAVDQIVPPGAMVPGQCPEVSAWDTWYMGKLAPEYLPSAPER